MSCITKLLELKGNKEFLPVNDHVVIEGGGNYKDYEYLITFTSNGFRCGYVGLKEKETEIFENEKKNYGGCYYPSLECHCGVTFYDDHRSIKKILPIKCNDLWVGFDCGHYDDGLDIHLVDKYFPDIDEKFKPTKERALLFGGLSAQSYEYVEKDCMSIIDQLISKMENVSES